MMARAVLEERLGELESSQREQMSAVEVLWERFKVLKSRTSALFPRQRKERTAEERRAAEARAASHWIDLSEVLGHARGSNSGGRLTLSAAPAAKKVDGLCDMGADHIVTLLRSDETMCAKVKAACTKRGVGWTHLPLSGGRVDGEGDMETLAQLPAVVDLLRRGRSVVLHCAAGMHRTGVAAYITLRLAGCSPAAAKDAVLAMREVTHEELTKGRKRGGPLCDRAETLFSTTFQRENGVLKADPNQGTKQDGGEEGLTKFSLDPPTTIANHDAASVKAASLTPCAPPSGVSAEARRFMIESGGAEWETVDLSPDGIATLRAETSEVAAPGCQRVLEETGASTESAVVGGVPVLWVRPNCLESSDVIFFLYGGGFVSGCPEDDLSITCRLASRTGCRVCCPTYRIAPEHPYPAGFNDALAVYRELLAGSGVAAVVGESAGGNLALRLLQHAASNGLTLPRAVALLSPWVDLTHSGDSHVTLAGLDPTLSVKHFLEPASRAYAGVADVRSPDVSPLFAPVPAGFPPTLLSSATRDLLLSDSVRLAAKLRAEGIQVELVVAEGLWHVYEWYPELPEAAQSLSTVAEFLNRHR